MKVDFAALGMAVFNEFKKHGTAFLIIIAVVVFMYLEKEEDKAYFIKEIDSLKSELKTLREEGIACKDEIIELYAKDNNMMLEVIKANTEALKRLK